MNKWKIWYSKTLNMKVAYNEESGRVKTEDQVWYEPKELDKMAGSSISLGVHQIKKIFEGEIVK